MDDRSGPAARPAIGRSVAAVSFGFALIQLDVTIVNVALPTMDADLHTGIAGLQWVVDAYALVFAATLLSGGYLADMVGARRVYLAGMALFAVTSLACGLAPNGGAMIAARVAQGVGAAAMLPSSLSLLNHACAGDARLRGWAIGWWTSAASIALASGPVLGGVLVRFAGWRWIFLVNLPLCLLGAWLALRLRETEALPGRRIDVPGQLLGGVALGSLTAAVIEAGTRGPTAPMVLMLVAVALLSGVGFAMVERRIADPMIPGRLFDAPVVAVALVFGALINVAYYGMLFVLSLYLQEVIGFDALHAGLAYVPLTVTFIAVNGLSGWVAGRSGARWPMVAGAAVGAIGYGLLIRLDAASSYVSMLPAFILIPAGMGFAIPAMYAGVLAGVDPRLSGTASAAVNATRQAGGVIGVALFGALAAGAGGIVGGLQTCAAIAAASLAGLALLAAIGLRRRHA